MYGWLASESRLIRFLKYETYRQGSRCDIQNCPYVLCNITEHVLCALSNLARPYFFFQPHKLLPHTHIPTKYAVSDTIDKEERENEEAYNTLVCADHGLRRCG